MIPVMNWAGPEATSKLAHLYAVSNNHLIMPEATTDRRTWFVLAGNILEATSSQ